MLKRTKVELLLTALVIIIWSVFFVIYYSYAHENYPWIAKYRGKSGAHCCGERDCIKVHARILNQYDDSYDLEITIKENGKTFIVEKFPKKGYHISEDENDWYCFYPKSLYEDFASPGDVRIEDDPCASKVTNDCINCAFISPKM